MVYVIHVMVLLHSYQQAMLWSEKVEKAVYMASESDRNVRFIAK
jgi:hypothetical protein